MRNIFNPTKWPKVRRGAQTARSSASVIGKPEAAETDFQPSPSPIEFTVSALFRSYSTFLLDQSRISIVERSFFYNYTLDLFKVILIEKEH